MRSYLISLCAAGILCGILSTIVPAKGSIGKVFKLLSGLFLLYTLISPLITLRLQDFSQYFDELALDADLAVSIGTAAAQEDTDRIITQRLQAYISDKASSLGADLIIDVTLQNSIPSAVSINGPASPYVKNQLSKWITNNLGIEAEAQYWNE